MAKPYFNYVFTSATTGNGQNPSGDLGTVFSEQNQINISQQGGKTPLTPTSGNVQINLGGKMRLIVIQGAHDGTNFTKYFSGSTITNQEDKVKQFILEIENWLNVGVVSPQKYTNSFGTYYYVVPTDFTWVRSFRDPNRILYTLLIREGKVLG